MTTFMGETCPYSDQPAQRQELVTSIQVRERNYQHASKSIIHLDDKTAMSQEGDCRHYIERMEKIAKRITHGTEEVTRKVSGGAMGRVRKEPTYALTALGQAVWTLCRAAIPVIEQAFLCSRYKGRYSTSTIPWSKPDVLAVTNDMETRFNPYVTLMLRACQRSSRVLRGHGGFDLDVNDQAIRNKLNWLVRFVRRVCRSKRFRRIETNRVRLQRKDLESCCRYMASGFHRHSRLLVLRVDLYIRPTHKTHEDVRIAEKCLQLYLRALAEYRIVPDVKRWVCKRECGVDRGMHYHLLVALDGHKHQSACALSQLLGETWVKRCGPLRASYFNCYTRRHLYEYNALGSVHISDEEMLLGIRKALQYMVKGDGFIMTGHKRNLFRGVTKQSWQRPKRGAPRKADHDMSLVDRILGNPLSEMNEIEQ